MVKVETNGKLTRERRRQLADQVRRARIRLWSIARELEGLGANPEHDAVARAALVTDEAHGTLDPRRK